MERLLLELLFAQCYDERCNQGDRSVESGWTIAVLCRSLVASYLPVASDSAVDSARDTLRASYRRALSKPLYRSWKFATAVSDDAHHAIRAGQSSIKSRLQTIEECFEEGAAGGDDAMTLYAQDVVRPLILWSETLS